MMVELQVRLLPKGARDFMESSETSAVERFLLAAQLAGLNYEADFWRLARKVYLNSLIIICLKL